MENLIESYYLEPDQIPAAENEEDVVDFEIEEADLVLDTEDTSEEKDESVVDIVRDTQTQVIPETQNSQKTQIVPETQDVITIDD